jgi:hypothetical protein
LADVPLLTECLGLIVEVALHRGLASVTGSLRAGRQAGTDEEAE